MKKGPRTLLSVAFPVGGLLSELTRAETPNTSERRMNSWRMGVHILPVRVRKSIVVIHSSVVMLGQEERAKEVHVMSIARGEKTMSRTRFVSVTNP